MKDAIFTKKCPMCELYFHTSNMRQIFSSRKCTWTYHNRKNGTLSKMESRKKRLGFK
jgi:hypothetical protein